MEKSAEEENSQANLTRSIDIETQAQHNEEDDQIEFQRQLLDASQQQDAAPNTFQQIYPDLQNSQQNNQHVSQPLPSLSLPYKKEVMITVPPLLEKQEYQQANNKNSYETMKTQQSANGPIESSVNTISDRKVWAVQGRLPGQVSKKFVRSYKVGVYNKFKSLKEEVDFLNSPHHEPKHLGNQIFPFQNNLKDHIHVTGRFDYSKYVNKDQQQQQQGNKRFSSGQPKIFSPRTTSSAVMSQILYQQKQKQMIQKQEQQQQMEIRYIDIVSQPLIKSASFVNNKKCAHGMVNLRHCGSQKRNNAFSFAPPAPFQQAPNIQSGARYFDNQEYTSPLLHVNSNFEPLVPQYTSYQTLSGFFSPQVEVRPAEIMFSPESTINKEYDYTSHYQDYQVSKSSLSLQPKNVFLPKSVQTTSNSFHPQKTSKNQSRNQINQLNSQPRLPAFATVVENLSYFSKAKHHLINYVNDIGVKENPLSNTFVQKPKLI